MFFINRELIQFIFLVFICFCSFRLNADIFSSGKIPCGLVGGGDSYCKNINRINVDVRSNFVGFENRKLIAGMVVYEIHKAIEYSESKEISVGRVGRSGVFKHDGKRYLVDGASVIDKNGGEVRLVVDVSCLSVGEVSYSSFVGGESRCEEEDIFITYLIVSDNGFEYFHVKIKSSSIEDLYVLNQAVKDGIKNTIIEGLFFDYYGCLTYNHCKNGYKNKG